MVRCWKICKLYGNSTLNLSQITAFDLILHSWIMSLRYRITAVKHFEIKVRIKQQQYTTLTQIACQRSVNHVSTNPMNNDPIWKISETWGRLFCLIDTCVTGACMRCSWTVILDYHHYFGIFGENASRRPRKKMTGRRRLRALDCVWCEDPIFFEMGLSTQSSWTVAQRLFR